MFWKRFRTGIAMGLPHLLMVIGAMLLTFFLIDRFNTAMNFVNNDLTKGLVIAAGILIIPVSVLLIVKQRSNHCKYSSSKHMPVPVVIALDLLLLAAGLLTYAYFHHVASWELDVTPEIPSGAPHGIMAWDVQDTEEMTNKVADTAYPDTEPFPGTSAESDSPVTSETPNTTDSRTKSPHSDPYEGTIPEWNPSAEDTVYQSDAIRMTLTRKEVNVGNGTSVVFIADIYVRYAENLRSGLARDKFGVVREHTLSMANRLGAVIAINGDYYGSSRTNLGAVIRNGTLYNGTPRSADVLVMFYDGTMQVVPAEEFNGEALIAQGAYQSWDFGPSLLHDGVPYTADQMIAAGGVKSGNPRTVIGYYEPGHYCFVTVNGRRADGISAGLRIGDLAKFMSELGCKLAYNLDGGATSVMVFDGKLVNSPCDGKEGRMCSDIIYIGELQ